MKIIGRDNLARETVADKLLLAWFPKQAVKHAQDACDALNKFTCDDNGGTHCVIVEDDYRLSRGMEDLV